MNATIRPVLAILLWAIAVYLGHECLLYLLGKRNNSGEFYYPLFQVYGFFFAGSSIIIAILIKVRHKNIDHVGQVFLLLTCVKMAIAYAFLLPILQSSTPTAPLEKVNFFFAFALFLTLETVFTIRVLNKS